MALVELGRFEPPEAHIVVGRLNAEGIFAIAFDANAGLAESATFLIPVRVMVDEDELAPARAALTMPE